MGKDNKLLLIEPPFYRLFKPTFSLDRFPLSLAYLAGSVLERTDWDVRVCNADFTPKSEGLSMRNMDSAFANYVECLKDPSRDVWQQLKAAVAAQAPKVVGITAKSQNYRSACIVARLVKEIDPGIVVLMGGPHASMVGPEVMSCPDVDVAVRGEGEVTIVELLNAVREGKGYGGVAGIVYREDGRVVETPPRAFIEDLDSLPYPHQVAPRVLDGYEQYPPEAFSFIFATRGCPNNCFFCGSRNIWSRRVRFRSPENVTREIASLQKMGLKHVHFDDDFFGVNRKHIQALCSTLVRDCPGIHWSCEIHPRLAIDENISIMKQAGCNCISVGIESGNNDMLKRIRKTITIEDGIAAGRTIRKHGILLQAFFMVGFPDETEATMMDTFAAMKKMAPAVLAYSIFTPYPGTEAFQYCREKGLIREDYDCSLFNHQSPANFFCANIGRERFRELASEIEKFVVRNNSMFFMRNVSFSNVLDKLRKYGLRRAAGKLARRIVRMAHP